MDHNHKSQSSNGSAWQRTFLKEKKDVSVWTSLLFTVTNYT